MDRMEVTRDVRRLLREAEEMGSKMEADCKLQTVRNQRLTEQLEEARVQIERLEKRANHIERRYAELRAEHEQTLLEVEATGVEDGLEGEVNPLHVFPEEIWGAVFGHVKDPKDLKNCSETCTTFQRILQDQKSMIIFPEVLKILATRDPAFRRPFFNKFMSQVWQGPRNSELKKCRLVCQGWKHSVDAFCQDHYIIFPDAPFDDSNSCSSALPFRVNNNPWNNPVIQEMDSTSNPMPCGFLSYEDHPLPILQKRRFRRSFIAFLAKFGQHVHFFDMSSKVDPRGNETSHIAWYPSLMTFLPLMPNLEGLYLRKPLSGWWEVPFRMDEDPTLQWHADEAADDAEEKWKIYQQVNQLLEVEVSRVPFPAIPSLTTVVFEDCPPSLVESVLKATPQVERLKLRMSKDSASDKFTYNFNPFPLDKLDELKISRLDGRYLDLSKVCEFGSVNWNLRKLTLDIGCTAWKELFDVLANRFGGSLVELNLVLDQFDYHGDCCADGPTLNLPNLKTLNVKLHGVRNSIDFILPLVKLEYFRLEILSMMRRYHHVDKVGPVAESIQLHEVNFDLTKSNIWKLMPRLKKVLFRNDYDVKRGRYYGVNSSAKWRAFSRNQIGG